MTTEDLAKHIADRLIRQWSHFTFLHKADVDDTFAGTSRWKFQKAMNILKAAGITSGFDATVNGWAITRASPVCRKCGKRLKDPASIAKGFGTKCHAKARKLQQIRGQMVLQLWE